MGALVRGRSEVPPPTTPNGGHEGLATAVSLREPHRDACRGEEGTGASPPGQPAAPRLAQLRSGAKN